MHPQRALISVSDKTAVVQLGRALHELGIALLSTGGTAQLLRENQLPVTEISNYTGLAEMLDGRVKTLHPKIHAGILAQRHNPQHQEALKQADIPTIDLVVVNLYPFEQVTQNAQCSLAEAIENIDIGGPTLVRAAAKNWQDVAVLTDASQYDSVIQELQAGKGLSHTTLFQLAVQAFNRISQYDGAISNYLSACNAQGERILYPQQLNRCYTKRQDLRYGENPQQTAALYTDIAHDKRQTTQDTLASAELLQGKALSYNNLVDADAAWETVKLFDAVACVIIKHANPCGVGIAPNTLSAYHKALRTDSTSAFGGVIAFNTRMDVETAEAVLTQFVEVIIAPDYSAQALQVFASKANVRLLKVALAGPSHPLQIKQISGGVLVQSSDTAIVDFTNWQVVTTLAPNDAQIADLRFVWQVARQVKSNAIVFGKDGMTLGVGAGQMSRVDSTRLAVMKAQSAGLDLQNSVVASMLFSHSATT